MESEKLKLQFDGPQVKTNTIELIFWIISYISWPLLTINSCVSLRWLYKKKFMRIWTIKVVKDFSYLPFQMHQIVIYIVFNLSVVIIFFGCVYLFITTLIRKNQDTIKGLIRIPTRFHFFPILCGFIMFTLGEADSDTTKEINSIYRAGFAISLIGLISMIYIYITTEFGQDNWVATFIIKKGVFSCLIVLFWYNFCYDIFYIHQALRPRGKRIFNWMKGCGLAFSIIFGLGSNVFSLLFKDILICCFNLIIYIGLTIFYYKYERKRFSYSYYYYYYNYDDYQYRYYIFNDKKNKGDGIVDFIMICISSILLIYLIAYFIKNSEIDKIKKINRSIEDINNEIKNLKIENENIKKEIKIIITDRIANAQ